MRYIITALAVCLSVYCVQWGCAGGPGYVSLDEVGREYAVSEVMDLNQGAVAVWVKFLKGHPRRDHSIFHTDDSRFVLFIDTYYSQGMKRDIMRIGARAGGNRGAVDSSRGVANFPEASIIVDNDGSLRNYGKGSAWASPAPFPEGEWHHVAMTWNGYPEGVVSIYLDGRLMGKKPYDGRYDDGRPLARIIVLGIRPAEWTGELVKTSESKVIDMRPRTDMSLQSGGIEISDLRIYRSALNQEEITGLASGGRPGF